MNDPLSVLASWLELHLCSESEDNGAIRASADVWRNTGSPAAKAAWCNVQQSVELNALLGLKEGCPEREEVWAQAISDIASDMVCECEEAAAR